MDDLLREFLTETNESLDTVDNQLVKFEQDPNNAKILDNIFRLVHTIKGTCGFLGLPRLEALAHAAETLMGKFRDGMPVTGEAVSLILSTIDRIKDILSQLEATEAEPEGSDPDLIGALEQMVVAEYFSKHFEEHVGELSAQLKDKLDTMVEAVEREFGTAVEPWLPKGGIFLWMKLPDEVDVRKLVQPALAAGIAFNPGPEWAVDGEAAKSRLRLCFGLTTKQEIREGVAGFARVCYEQFGIPE